MTRPGNVTPEFEFDLRHLEVFCKVAELGSFSRAGEAVHLAQASVSERIANLERAVGTRLLDRLGRKVELTLVGKHLYSHAVELLQAKQRACQELAELMGGWTGTLELGASSVPGDHLLPKCLNGFLQQHSGVRLCIQIEGSGAIVEKVSSGRLELGVVGAKNDHSSLTYKNLWTDEIVLVGHPARSPTANRRLALAELLQAPLVLREESSGTRRRFMDHLRKLRSGKVPQLNVVAELGSSNAVKEAVQAGMGFTAISRHAVEGELNQGEMVLVPVKGFPLKRQFYLVRDKRRTPSPLGRALEAYLLMHPHRG